MRTLVLGIGNLLLRDDGVGVHAIHALHREHLPSNIKALEIGTAFLDALHEIEQADRIIIIDAMQADHAPGTVYRVPLDDCVRAGHIASLHGFDMSHVLFLAGRTKPMDVIVIGVEPARIEWGTELSPQVRDALPAVIETIKTELAQYDTGDSKQTSLSKTRFLSSEDSEGGTLNRERKKCL